MQNPLLLFKREVEKKKNC
uniref:Uncharacterized protein n=1 Tax=Rhizophora mucronata TaxID=61149 RepID=A0A2P2PN31_RHIMU